MLVYGRDQEIMEWVCARTPHSERGFSAYVAAGLEQDGELIAGWVFSDYHGNTISLSLASTSPRWCSRKTLRAIFSYPFAQLQCKRVTAITGGSMTNVRRLLAGLGFAEEGVLRCGFADDDAVIYGMLKEECRWIL